MNNSLWRRDLSTITSVYSSPPNPDTSIEVKCEEKSAYVDLTNPETPFVSKCTGKAARRSLPYTAQERWAKLLPPRRADVCLSFSLSLFLTLSPCFSFSHTSFMSSRSSGAHANSQVYFAPREQVRHQRIMSNAGYHLRFWLSGSWMGVTQFPDVDPPIL